MTAEWIEADSDDAALDHVRGRKERLSCEVWDRQRLVGRIEAYRA